MQRRPLTLIKLSRTYKQAKMIENPLILSKLLSDASQFLSLNSSELIGAIAHPRTFSRTEIFRFWYRNPRLSEVRAVSEDHLPRNFCHLSAPRLLTQSLI